MSTYPTNDIYTLLKHEYQMWSISQKQLFEIIKNVTFLYDIKKVKQIFERWYMMKYSYFNGVLDKELKDHPATQGFKHDLVYEHLFTEQTIDQVINRILSITPDIPPIDKPVIQNGTIIYGNFIKPILSNRLKLLQQMASDEQITLMSLKYDTIVPGGNQWSIPSKVYDILVNKYDVTIEGFASPLNSQILKYRQTIRFVYFCSLFLEIDRPFGSIGNFFDTQFEGHVSVINPPFVIDIMNAVADKCLETMTNASSIGVPTRMFIFVPMKPHTYYFNALIHSKFYETHFIHNDYRHYYEDPTTDRLILSAFTTVIFVLSVAYPPGNYDDINNAFKVPDNVYIC